MSTKSGTRYNETHIEADPDLPLVRITREFGAPPEKLFRAHTDPDLIVQWLGPRSLDETRVEHWDCRTGGSWRYVSTRGDEEYRFRGCFHEVREPECIVQTFTYEGFPDGVSLEKVVFEPLDGGRTRLVATSLVDSFEGRNAFLASGMEVGVREGYERLDELLAS